MSDSATSFSILLKHAVEGDAGAANRLLLRYRDRLKWMVRVHLDRQAATELDASDVVNEALRQAVDRLPEFSATSVPFYVWLRQIAGDRLSVVCEGDGALPVENGPCDATLDAPQKSHEALAKKFHRSRDEADNPSDSSATQIQTRLREAISRLDGWHREVLSMRFLERMTISEIAAACDIGEDDAKLRQLRSVQRLNELFDRDSSS